MGPCHGAQRPISPTLPTSLPWDVLSWLHQARLRQDVCAAVYLGGAPRMHRQEMTRTEKGGEGSSTAAMSF